MKTALITGITGQIGSFMADLLIENKYEVYGMIRRSASRNTKNINHIIDKINILEGDLTDQSSLDRIFRRYAFDEVYNFAGQSFVPTSFTNPISTLDITGLGTVRLLESIRNKCSLDDIKIYHNSSSEMFGNEINEDCIENSKMLPVSPLGAAKLLAHNICLIYRNTYNMDIRTGICFNSESERRGDEFVIKKICIGAVNSYLYRSYLRLGNIHAMRDWHYTGDTVKAIKLIMDQDEPDDYIIASGETHSVEEAVRIAYNYLNLDYEVYLIIREELKRDNELHRLVCKPTKLNKLGWRPTLSLKDIIKRIIDNELNKRYQQLNTCGRNFKDFYVDPHA